MKSWHALALMVLVIALAWVVLVERREQARTVPVVVDARENNAGSEPSQEVAGVREEQAAMKKQPARVLQQQAYRPPPDRLVPTRQAQPQAATGDAREREVQERQHIEQILSHLEGSFRGEPYDSSWAPQIEAGITEDFEAEAGKGHALEEVNCRSTLCRIVVVHENPDAAGAFVLHMGTLRGFANTEGFYQRITREDGPTATVIYMARQGYRLPAMPPPFDIKGTENALRKLAAGER